jgi:hypothetical protein
VTVLQDGQVLTSGPPMVVSNDQAVINAYLGAADTSTLDAEALITSELLP